MDKIGILGGTFDPVHHGHLFLAEKIMHQFQLDCVIFLPNGNPPHKQDVSASAEDRLAMLRIAVASHPLFMIEEHELHKTEHSYTYQTLQYFKEKYPTSHLFFIAGADNIEEIAAWKRPEEIFRLADVIFCSRPGYQINHQEIERLKKNFSAVIHLVEVQGVDVSATEIRNRLQNKRPVVGLLPDAVATYIHEHRLYDKMYLSYQKQLKQYLTPERFRHTMGVAIMAEKLALHYDIDSEKAYLAGLLHDCAKNLPEEEQRALIQRNRFPIYEGELVNPHLLHGIAGSVLAEEMFQMKDPEILSAIRYHTVGKIDMSVLEKIIYLADLTEENRIFPFAEKLRQLTFEDLDRALLLSMENTIDYLSQKGQSVLKETYHIRESLLNKGVDL